MSYPISQALQTLQFRSPADEAGTKTAFFQQIRSDLLNLMGFASPGAKEAMVESGAADQESFLLSPEISHLAIHATKDQAEAVSQFLYKAVLAEAAKTTGDTGPFEALWSVRGDFFIDQSQGLKEPFVFHAPKILEQVAVDFNSPYCSFISNEELGAAEETPIVNYPLEQMEGTIDLVRKAISPLEESLPDVIRFIQQFTYHLIAKVHPVGDFSSGSNGLYIGRVVLCNVEAAPAELIAEALVHEAAHGYLYMLETLQPWMPSHEHSRKLGPSIPSTWTGNHISLRSFSQAIFVWYSLWQFWKRAQALNLFRADFVAQRILFIQHGFEKLDLKHLQKLASGTIPSLSMTVFQELKSSILSPSKLQS